MCAKSGVNGGKGRCPIAHFLRYGAAEGGRKISAVHFLGVGVYGFVVAHSPYSCQLGLCTGTKKIEQRGAYAGPHAAYYAILCGLTGFVGAGLGYTIIQGAVQGVEKFLRFLFVAVFNEAVVYFRFVIAHSLVLFGIPCGISHFLLTLGFGGRVPEER